ncbi:cell division protein ZapE [Psychrosphaera saromensis]|uniref:Cell division protein ZapE n=1 Tax=Psychrosphaera saromensis TaxID=716813 RepID=A0A2S7UXL4_9GAMM|nr:cell division protein ZapE [Psychrosphaera saromensis]PQJ54488.1 cell division protein ZapE [Psychrosphaera saromensis]GHB59553.1 cell division protein ZapE [Psychrosphaera saromensis]GLQ14310.1 cell division protein ZapE [Psychrosphaera saromensis]
MPNKSPLSQYQALVSANQISFDAGQQQAVELLQQLYLTLQPDPISNTNQKLTNKKLINKNKAAIQGIYLWGKVGRGKTFLMDLFVHSLDGLCKRQHFHHFMQDVHSQLNELAGKTDPLKLIAQSFAKQFKVLCFDEFFVSDIGDAMLLGNLLQFMFELNIVVVSTSNCAPHELYRNGLQRERFLPAIAAIEKHTQVLHLNGLEDHRLRTLTHVENYFQLPNTAEQQVALHQQLLKRFNLSAFSKSAYHDSNTAIQVLGRSINYVAKSIESDVNSEHDKVICFDFSELCQGARSHFDYVELAKQFKTILLFNVPPMSGQSYERIKARGTEDNGTDCKEDDRKEAGRKGLRHNVSAGITGEREVVLAPMDDAARRFIALVDECYDGNLNLVISAYVPQSELYNSGTLLFEFERTKSRLVEMASKEYLNKGINLREK